MFGLHPREASNAVLFAFLPTDLEVNHNISISCSLSLVKEPKRNPSGECFTKNKLLNAHTLTLTCTGFLTLL